MNTKTRTFWLQALSASLLLNLFFTMPSYAAGADSSTMTQFRPNQASVKPGTPVAEPDTTQCIVANESQHNWYAQVTMSTWQGSTCPDGYMPYQLQTKMNGGGVGQLAIWYMEFRNYCCKTKVVYKD